MAQLARTLRTQIRIQIRAYATILSPDSKTPLSALAKTRAALSLLKSETNPEKVLEICRAAALTPEIHLDRLALSAAVTNLARSNNFSYVKSFLDELRSTRPDLRSDRFNAHAIFLFGQARMVDHAVSLFKEVGSGSVRCFNALVFACVLAKDFKEMKRVYVDFPRMYNVVLDVESYNRVIKGFSESGEAGSGYSVLTEMDKNGVKPNATTFAEMVAGFYAEEKLDEVEKVLELMKEKYGMTPGVPMWNARMKSLCKLRKSKEAKELLDAMLKKRQKPNSGSYTELIHGFCREGNLEEAKSLFKSMLNRGLKPESSVYFTLVHFLIEGKNFETAMRVCKESIGKGWVPNVSTMMALVKGLKSTGKVEEAKELIGDVKRKVSKKLEMWEEVEAGLATA